MTYPIHDYQIKAYCVGKYICLKTWVDNGNELYVEFLDEVMEKLFVKHLLTDKREEIMSDIAACYGDISSSNTYYSGRKDIDYYFRIKKEFMFLENLIAYLSSHSLFGQIVEQIKNEMIVKDIVE